MRVLTERRAGCIHPAKRMRQDAAPADERYRNWRGRYSVGHSMLDRVRAAGAVGAPAESMDATKVFAAVNGWFRARRDRTGGCNLDVQCRNLCLGNRFRSTQNGVWIHNGADLFYAWSQRHQPIAFEGSPEEEELWEHVGRPFGPPLRPPIQIPKWISSPSIISCMSHFLIYP